MVGGMIDISLHWQAGQQYRSLFTEHPQPMWVQTRAACACWP